MNHVNFQKLLNILTFFPKTAVSDHCAAAAACLDGGFKNKSLHFGSSQKFGRQNLGSRVPSVAGRRKIGDIVEHSLFFFPFVVVFRPSVVPQ